MKRYIQFALIALLFAAPALWAQDSGEVGAFAEYFRYSYAPTPENFFGVGGRAAFNVSQRVQIEAEMAYDFQRNYTSTFNNTISSTTVTSHQRTLHGFFGPKFQTGGGALRLFVTGKVGFDNFTYTTSPPVSGFNNSVGLSSGTTAFALYPAGGVEAFVGPIGLRIEAGDDVFFLNGAHNNLRVSIGPQFRF
ncbi:MAG TPA: hypothetical protein VMF10_03030 [Candidatus Aquilonibacter sp.]|nr:hypothetical protein [Candidatus Aquilonibacter sp.]